MTETTQPPSSAVSRASCRAVRIHRAVSAPRAVPIALESVHAGFPSVAQDYFAGDFSFDEHIIEHPETTFIVTVAGDSMQGAGIWDGDLLVVDRSLAPQSGDVVVAVLDSELTVKRLLVQGSRPVLHAENPRYPDFRPSDDEELTIWGVVTGNFHPQRHGAYHDAARTANPLPGIAGTGHAASPATPPVTHPVTRPATQSSHTYPHDGWAL